MRPRAVLLSLAVSAAQDLPEIHVRKPAARLRAALDEYIANARRTPTWNRLAVKYFGPAAPEILRNSARK